MKCKAEIATLLIIFHEVKEFKMVLKIHINMKWIVNKEYFH